MNGLFSKLDDEKLFVAFVREQYNGVPSEITSVMGCELVLDENRIQFAYNEYQQGLTEFEIFLHSKNPDHYKRSGALLHALYSSECVVGVKLEAEPDDLETGFTRITRGDAEYVLPYVKFFKEFHNQFLAFNTAYRCCAAYEPSPTSYNFDYLHNICRYLRNNDSLSRDSFFMLFKSLMA